MEILLRAIFIILCLLGIASGVHAQICNDGEVELWPATAAIWAGTALIMSLC